ncbi:hypothetical protein LSH36_48g07009 [Paralvinella palmiformis]|uniref:Methyltransferase FkbM domain-containing protein n=1 Tax=Paralvinella palmiformis TaxID=53620 RepID=A0AAD9NER0_9ANNE|nr:hypothetical protein LSH36_48g07009 [Paralvinella palmiformis]
MSSPSRPMFFILSIIIMIIFLGGWNVISNNGYFGVRSLHFNLRSSNFSPKEVDKRDWIHSYKPTPNDIDTWIVPNIPDHLRNADQTDPELIRHIRQFWIIPPFEGPISLQRHKNTFPVPGMDFSQSRQPTIINQLLFNKTEGFYVECGAADGEYHSNSLFYELYHHWDGILIEANPLYFKTILRKKRRVFMLNACLSPTRRATVLNFTQNGISGGLTDLIPDEQGMFYKHKKKPIEIQCFPLYSILSALEIKKVDYFSLDIEGAEVEVLQTIPLNETIINVLSVEKRIMNNNEGTSKKIDDIMRVLKPFGYRMERIVQLDVIVSRLPRI